MLRENETTSHEEAHEALHFYLPQILKSWMRSEKAQTLVEYGLILALISVTIIAVMGLVSSSISDVVTNVNDALNSVDEIQQKQ